MGNSAYWLFSDELLQEQDYDKICKCSPKCSRNVFKTSISQGVLSESMVENFASSITLPASLKGSLHIEDYITMDRTNREWTKTLFEISNAYETLKNKVLSVRHLIGNLTSESTNQLEAPMALCLIRAAESIGHSLHNFSIWENSSYYLGIDNSKRPSENFMSRMAHDSLRKRNEMHGFSAGCLLEIEHIENSVVSAGHCNDSNAQYTMNTTREELLEAKLIMQHITAKYMMLQTDVSQNHPHLRLSSIHNYTTEEYITWVGDTVSRRWIDLPHWISDFILYYIAF